MSVLASLLRVGLVMFPWCACSCGGSQGGAPPDAPVADMPGSTEARPVDVDAAVGLSLPDTGAETAGADIGAVDVAVESSKPDIGVSMASPPSIGEFV